MNEVPVNYLLLYLFGAWGVGFLTCIFVLALENEDEEFEDQ